MGISREPLRQCSALDWRGAGHCPRTVITKTVSATLLLICRPKASTKASDSVCVSVSHRCYKHRHPHFFSLESKAEVRQINRERHYDFPVYSPSIHIAFTRDLLQRQHPGLRELAAKLLIRVFPSHKRCSSPCHTPVDIRLLLSPCKRSYCELQGSLPRTRAYRPTPQVPA